MAPKTDEQGQPVKQLTERQQRRRSDILEAARDLIAEHGYDGVTMRQLAARSDVAVKTLYLLYGNKEELVTTAAEDGHQAFYAELDKAEIDDGLDRLFFIIDSITRPTLDARMPLDRSGARVRV